MACERTYSPASLYAAARARTPMPQVTTKKATESISPEDTGRTKSGKTQQAPTWLARKGETLQDRGHILRVIHQNAIAVGLRRKILIDSLRPQAFGRHDFVKEGINTLFDLNRFGVALGKQILHIAMQPHMLAIKHLRVQVGPEVL